MENQYDAQYKYIFPKTCVIIISTHGSYIVKNENVEEFFVPTIVKVRNRYIPAIINNNNNTTNTRQYNVYKVDFSPIGSCNNIGANDINKFIDIIKENLILDDNKENDNSDSLLNKLITIRNTFIMNTENMKMDFEPLFNETNIKYINSIQNKIDNNEIENLSEKEKQNYEIYNKAKDSYNNINNNPIYILQPGTKCFNKKYYVFLDELNNTNNMNNTNELNKILFIDRNNQITNIFNNISEENVELRIKTTTLQNIINQNLKHYIGLIENIVIFDFSCSSFYDEEKYENLDFHSSEELKEKIKINDNQTYYGGKIRSKKSRKNKKKRNHRKKTKRNKKH